MKLTEKKFNLVQLTNKYNRIVIQEEFYVLGFSLYYFWHNTNAPFNLMSSAILRREELEKIEKESQLKRDIFISVVLIVTLSLLWF